MMQHNNGILIMGSATPDVTTFYRAQHHDLTYLHMPNRIMGIASTLRTIRSGKGHAQVSRAASGRAHH